VDVTSTQLLLAVDVAQCGCAHITLQLGLEPRLYRFPICETELLLPAQGLHLSRVSCKRNFCRNNATDCHQEVGNFHSPLLYAAPRHSRSFQSRNLSSALTEWLECWHLRVRRPCRACWSACLMLLPHRSKLLSRREASRWGSNYDIC